jgi:sulfate permease, SulP family
MATVQPAQKSVLTNYLPFLDWLVNYRREDLSGDLIAGVVVTVMLVPQSMAYASLANLPPQVGLYASILPLLIYGLLGTSRAMAVGPVAIVSLMVGSGIAQFDTASLTEVLLLAVTLALMVGVVQLGLGLLRVGFLVNFLSHPVLSGFINAAALVIGFSQLKHVMGIAIPRQEHTYEEVAYALEHLGQTNMATLALALLGVSTLLFFKYMVPGLLRRFGLSDTWILPLSRSGPLFAVAMGILTVWLGGLDVAIVGDVPAGLPPLTTPSFDPADWQMLLPTALTIALVGFMESISVAKSLASKRRQKVNANQELVALGVANLGAAFTGAYPVAGGIGRSVVNFSAGARTGLASIITAVLMAVTVLLLTPLFYYLPQAVLASIIVVAVIGLVDFKPLAHAWEYDRSDAASFLVTFVAVLLIGVETGILFGVVTGLALYLWRTSRPHIAVVGRVGESEHFRNVLRHDVQTHNTILVVRVDESLYFPNAQYLEGFLLNTISERPEVDHLVLICSAVNYIDVSALEVLESLHQELADSDVSLYMAEVKGPVMDRLEQIGFVDRIGRDHFFLSTHQAVETLV